MIESKNLTIELAKRIFGNLGAVVGDNFGKVGITTKEFLSDKNVKLKVDSDKLEKYSIWCAQLSSPPQFQIALTNIGIKNEPEFLLILTKKDDDILIGIRYSFYDSETAEFMIFREGQWVLMSILHKLNITTAIEIATQEGIVWNPSKEIIDKLYTPLIGVVEHGLKEDENKEAAIGLDDTSPV